MRTALIAGNWKMHNTVGEALTLVDGVLARVTRSDDREVLVCPPYTALHAVGERLRGSGLLLGAQDVHPEAKGAYTGAIAPGMLRDVGCRYVIVGHSERRQIFGEDDAVVAEKHAAARRAGLVPILCVGETLEERDRGVMEQVLARQLDAVLEGQGPKSLEGAVVAYEPVWAIGTGRTATSEQAQAVHAFLRARVGKRDAALAARLPILYGGSVKAGNAAELFAMPDVDGGLIGGASLVADEFLAIWRAAGLAPGRN